MKLFTSKMLERLMSEQKEKVGRTAARNYQAVDPKQLPGLFVSSRARGR